MTAVVSASCTEGVTVTFSCGRGVHCKVLGGAFVTSIPGVATTLRDRGIPTFVATCLGCRGVGDAESEDSSPSLRDRRLALGRSSVPGGRRESQLRLSIDPSALIGLVPSNRSLLLGECTGALSLPGEGERGELTGRTSSTKGVEAEDRTMSFPAPGAVLDGAPNDRPDELEEMLSRD